MVKYGVWYKSNKRCPNCKKDTLTIRKRYDRFYQNYLGYQFKCKRCGTRGLSY